MRLDCRASLCSELPPSQSEFLYWTSSIFWSNWICPLLVRFHVADHGMGENKDLSSNGNQGDLGRLTPAAESQIELLHAG